MTKLIAHEGEITTAHRGEGHQTDHIAERYATHHPIVVVALLHVPVHVAVDESEDDGLVSDECLVVALSVGDSSLRRTVIAQFVPHILGIPRFVGLLFDQLDPVVRHIHRQTVVKAVAFGGLAFAQSGQSAHFLGNSRRRGLDSVDKFVGKRQIGQRISVYIAIVVVRIGEERSPQAVVFVKHRGDPVEAEAVEAILREPVVAIGEEEVDHLATAVVKAE